MTLAFMLLAAPLGAAACLPIVADRITAADLARTMPAFAAAPGSEVLALTPAPGLRRSFSAVDLERWARRHGLSESKFSGGVCFEWPVAPLTETAIMAALRASVGNPDARLELREFSRQPAPPGELEFPRGGLMVPARWQPGEPLIWKGRVKYAERRSFSIWARVVVGVRGKRVVAKRDLAAGKVIAADEVTLEDRERLPFSAPDFDQLDQVVGRIPRRYIEAGKTIPATVLGEPRAVEKGDRVAVEARSGAMKLTMEAVSESGGRTGERVMLLNPSSGKRFPARIEGKRKAVALSPELETRYPKI
jgi:flagella basal body P-ring formation protein FlgA